MTKKKRERKERHQQERPAVRGKPGTLGEAGPEIEELERAAGNKVRVREMPDGSVTLDFSTPKA
jgi:hypothetical protein